MNFRTIGHPRAAIVLCVPLLALAVSASGQRPTLPAEEFAARRASLMAELKDGIVLLFGETGAAPGAHFRQDNDLFYFTGVEQAGAAVAMLPRTGDCVLFLPAQNRREIMVEGPNLLQDPDAPRTTGFSSVRPIGDLDEYLARSAERAGHVLHVRTSPRDTMDSDRTEVGLFSGRRARSHYNAQLPLDNDRLAKLRDRYPEFAFRDVTPLVDALRAVKTAAEIEVLRRNGRVSADAVREAMRAGAPGAYEYEVEAAAMAVALRSGARGAAFAPIVASGPNACVWHYDDNGRRAGPGEMILMDFGADLGHMAMDITRTWPASGRFTAEQREMYRAVLEVQKACIAAYRPGVTARDVREAVARTLKEKGVDPRGLEGGLGHGVGLSTHDVPLGGTLREGMVMAIEPALYDAARGIGIRIEDTVLITRDGCEVLTAGAPKEIDEIERLLAGRRP